MEKVLATDAAKSLATVKSSIADIAKFAKIWGERDEAKRLIDNCPAGSVALRNRARPQKHRSGPCGSHLGSGSAPCRYRGKLARQIAVR